jgi:hypothetical protein
LSRYTGFETVYILYYCIVFKLLFFKKTTIKKPEDQVQLTDAELNREYQLILNTSDSYLPTNIVHYSYKEDELVFKVDTNPTGDFFFESGYFYDE